MDNQFRAGMMRASDMCDAKAKESRAAGKAESDVYKRSDYMQSALALTEMSLAILTACEEPAEVTV